MTDARQQPPWKFWLSVTFFFLQIAVSLAAVAWIMIRGLETAGCSPGCGFTALMTNLYVFAGFCLLVLIVTVALAVRKRAWRWAWLMPAAGILAVAGGAVVANAVADAALMV